MAGPRKRLAVTWATVDGSTEAHAIRRRANGELTDRTECGLPVTAVHNSRVAKCRGCTFALDRNRR